MVRSSAPSVAIEKQLRVEQRRVWNGVASKKKAVLVTAAWLVMGELRYQVRKESGGGDACARARAVGTA